jgi:hypothetical protein
MKKYFFGWTNIKWVIKELVKMYSNEPSFFSYKRFQTGTAYFIFTQGCMFALTEYVKTTSDFVLWCVPVLLVCGYTLNHIQKEKNDNSINP